MGPGMRAYIQLESHHGGLNLPHPCHDMDLDRLSHPDTLGWCIYRLILIRFRKGMMLQQFSKIFSATASIWLQLQTMLAVPSSCQVACAEGHGPRPETFVHGFSL